MNFPRFPQTLWIAFGLIVLIVVARWVPHPPNFTPVLAVALLCGSLSPRLDYGVFIPIFGMLLGDLVLGWHASAWAVYLAIALCVVLGRWMLLRLSFGTILAGSVSASVLFFLLSNFAVWLQGDLYSLSGTGLLACYLAAIPFFHHTLLSTLFFAVGFWMMWRYFQRDSDLLTTSH